MTVSHSVVTLLSICWSRWLVDL